MNDTGDTLRPRQVASRPRWRPRVVVLIAVTACAVTLLASTARGQVRATYLYTLSNFGGRIPYDWVRIYADPQSDETYVISGNIVRIFNRSGMEIFRFGEDLDLGQILDVTADGKGDIILLSYRNSATRVTRCNFRGVPVGRIEITKLPAGVVFGANRMVFRKGLFYFASTGGASVIVTDASGEFREQIDLLSRLDPEERQKAGSEINGWTVDGEGNIFFTIAILFRVYKLSPDKKLSSFGRPGSAPGRFGVLGGVTADSRGNVVVVDKLKCAIAVFDKEFRFLTEFGYRGSRPENLIVPDDIAIDRADRIYVSQGRKRGVSVFALASG